MFSIGLTGGIGSGKSAVADLLVERGAWLIDADQVAREVVEPGGPAYAPLVDRFGIGILTSERTIDRQALADVAFADDAALADLNAITHPAIGIEMIERQRALSATDALVILAIPLLRPIHRETMEIDRVVVVDCPTDVAIARSPLRSPGRSGRPRRTTSWSTMPGSTSSNVRSTHYGTG